MKVLYVIHDFFPRFYGGAERYVLNLAHQMQRLGHQAAVLTYGLAEPEAHFTGRVGSLLSRSYVYEGIKVISVRHSEPPTDIHFRIEDELLADATGIVMEAQGTEIVHIAHPMRMASSYIAALARRGLLEAEGFARWEAVVAVARMSEPVPSDDLVELWSHWRAQGPKAAASMIESCLGRVALTGAPPAALTGAPPA